MKHPLHGILAAVGATVLLVGTGVWLSENSALRPEPANRPTELTGYDTSTVALARGPFCDLLDQDAISRALGAEVTDRTTWLDGDELPGVGVVNEYGCRLEAAGGAQARAWVLAPPVTPERARELADAARDERGCRARTRAPAYGGPSVALLCQGPRRTFASYRGLFGDAWLTCTLALPDDVPRRELVERTGDWCVAVAVSARR